jgi:hypothetical protein
MTTSFSDDNLPKAVDELVEALYRFVRGPAGQFRPEDVISAAAAFAGECVIRRAGDFDFDRHTFTPGQPIFSPNVTQLLSGDRADYEEMPRRTVFRGIYMILVHHPNRPWPRESFPDVRKIYERDTAARVHGVSKDWGKAPLSVPRTHYPSEDRPPLRAAFVLRGFVAKRWPNERPSAESLLLMAQYLVIMAMTQMRTQIEPKIGLLLAFETLNAMAKSAPLLPKHIQEFFRARGIQVPANML